MSPSSSSELTEPNVHSETCSRFCDCMLCNNLKPIIGKMIQIQFKNETWTLYWSTTVHVTGNETLLI